MAHTIGEGGLVARVVPLDLRGPRLDAAVVNLLLPQSRTGTVLELRPVDIHGDRYVDLHVALDDDGPGKPPRTGRVSATECPADLRPGDRVSVRFVMGVMTKVVREGAAEDG